MAVGNVAKVVGQALLDLVIVRAMKHIEDEARKLGGSFSEKEKTLARAGVVAGAMAMVDLLEEMESGRISS